MAISCLLTLMLSSVALAQSAGTFTATGNLTTERSFPTATLLSNGKVLIVGAPADGAELYDPSTRTFTAIGKTTALFSGNSATLLPDGRVLIAGGYAPGGALSAHAELYDPSTETFTATGDMTTARIGPHATLLANGKVLFVGGEATRPPFPADITAELYDPSTGTFAAIGTYSGAGPLAASATLFPDGRVLVVGYYSALAGNLRSGHRCLQFHRPSKFDP